MAAARNTTWKKRGVETHELMATRRKPKKALIQFAIAGVIAIAIGVGAVLVGMTLIQAMNEQSIVAQQEAEEAKLAAEEKAKLAEKKAQELLNSQNKSKVVQAAVDINPGQLVSKSMLEVVELEEKPGTGEFTNMNQVVGQVAIAAIKAGEAINRKKVKSSDGQIFVEDGKRAITIEVDNIGGLDGALSPGMSVDILLTVDADDKGGGGGSKSANGQMTRTLLQNIKIISSGDNASGASTSRRSSKNAVTLSVSPQQAEMLALANEVGMFHLTLRGFTDTNPAKLSGSDYQELITGVERSTLAKTTPPPPSKDIAPVDYASDLPEPSGPEAVGGAHKIEVYTGSGVKTVTFQQ